MRKRLTRRALLASGAAAAAMGSAVRRTAFAEGGSSITGVTWGGPWIAAWKQISDEQHAVDIQWVLHAAATTAIVAKIKVDWPNSPVDFVQATGTTFFMMMREGWLAPLTPQIIPNMAYLPRDVMVKDSTGNVVAIPTDLSALFWAYDANAIGMKIDKPEDLLSSKLRGKIMLNSPTIGSSAQLISLARARGGDEHNIQPGFDFVKDLIKAQNIGRVVKTDVEIANAFTTGQVAVGVLNLGNYHVIHPHVNLTLLNKVPGSPTFKTYMGYEGFAVLKKGGNRRPVYDFLNYCLGAKADGEYAASIGALPSNRLAMPSADVSAFRLAPDEVKKFGIYPDIAYISTQTDAWTQKWELEIAPLL